MSDKDNENRNKNDESLMATILDLGCGNTVLLGKATKEDLEKAVNYMRKQADVQIVMARMYEKMLQRLPKGKTVGLVVDGGVSKSEE